VIVEWIKCSDRLPSRGKMVLGTQGNYIFFCMYDPFSALGKDGLWVTEDHIEFDNITHWMPLPELPREEL